MNGKALVVINIQRYFQQKMTMFKFHRQKYDIVWQTTAMKTESPNEFCPSKIAFVNFTWQI